MGFIRLPTNRGRFCYGEKDIVSRVLLNEEDCPCKGSSRSCGFSNSLEKGKAERLVAGERISLPEKISMRSVVCLLIVLQEAFISSRSFYK